MSRAMRMPNPDYPESRTLPGGWQGDPGEAGGRQAAAGEEGGRVNAPRVSRITVHAEYDDGTFADMEADAPAHVSIGTGPPLGMTGYCTISILPQPGRPLSVSGTAVAREQQQQVERWLENSPWYREARA